MFAYFFSDKFQLMSKRMTEMEEIVSAKNTEIRHLKEDQIGHVLVEENFLENIEATFSKFQGAPFSFDRELF